MNILDLHYSDISFKTDAEDLQVIIDFINSFGKTMDSKDNKFAKIEAVMLKEIRHKLTMKVEQKKGSTKKFVMKFKAYQIYELMSIFSKKNDEINAYRPFEYNCILSYHNTFHQKLTGL